jgi:hypothetical protein
MTERDAKLMTRERLGELLDAYGADAARFPEAERAAALALLATDAEAMQLRAAALSLDELLDHAPSHEPSAALRARVAEIPIRQPRPARTSLQDVFGLRIWQMVVAGALACVLGVVSGILTTDDSTTTSDDGWDDVASVAFASNPGEEL